MKDIFDLSQFDEYKEDNRREVKKAEGGLPVSLWDTYSSFANIFNVWADEGWEEPVIEERFDPDRTILSLSFKKSGDKKAAIKSGDKKAAIKSGGKKVTKKTQMQYDRILEFMEDGKEYGIWDFCELLGLKESRTKDILKGLSDHIEIIGSNRDRRYKKK